MEKKIESKFAIIKGENSISIFDVRPSASQFETLLENVVIEIEVDNIKLEISELRTTWVWSLPEGTTGNKSI